MILYFLLLGLTPLAKAFSLGQREGEAMMYHFGSYPDNPIGPVLFSWQPPAALAGTDGEREREEGGGGGGGGGEKEGVWRDDERHRRLWIWSHPSIYEEVHKVLEEAIVPVETGQTADETEGERKDEASEASHNQSQSNRITLTSLRDELLRFRMLGPLSHQLSMKVLHPAATPVKKEAGELETEEEVEEEGVVYLKSCSKWAEIAKSSVDRKWWLKNEEFVSQAELIKQQHATLTGVSSPGDFISGTVIGLTVTDPRLFLPKKRTSLVSPLTRKPPKHPSLPLSAIFGEDVEEDEEESKMVEESPFAFGELTAADSDFSDEEEISERATMEVEMETLPADLGAMSDGEEKHGRRELKPVVTRQAATLGELPTQLAQSPLWSELVRKSVSVSKIPNGVINEIRSAFFVKPSKLNLGDEANQIPVILIEKTHQRATPLSLSFSTPQITGCDLILPASWGMAFWMSLVYNGGRACGMKEARNASLESLLPVFPNDYPDCLSGKTAAQEEKRMLEEKYIRYPPDKRPNFGKMNVQTPFHAPWGELVAAWKQSDVFREGVDEKKKEEEEEEEVEPDVKKMKLDREEEARKDCTEVIGILVCIHKHWSCCP